MCAGGCRHRLCHICAGAPGAVVPMEYADHSHLVRAVCGCCDTAVRTGVLEKSDLSEYETVLRYIEENGYEIAGEIRESYIDGVWNKDDESEWLSEIQVPVRRKTR